MVRTLDGGRIRSWSAATCRRFGRWADLSAQQNRVSAVRRCPWRLRRRLRGRSLALLRAGFGDSQPSLSSDGDRLEQQYGRARFAAKSPAKSGDKSPHSKGKPWIDG